jgi:rhodanese-related sulfurtransferase
VLYRTEAQEMVGAPLGLLIGSACLAASAWLFYRYIVRVHEARAWLSRGAVLVDVDSADDFARRHPRIAVSIPLEDLARRACEIGGKERLIVVFAHGWRRGMQAVVKLRGMGFLAVMNAAGVYTRERLGAFASSADEARQRQDLIELSRVSGGDFGPSPRDGRR